MSAFKEENGLIRSWVIVAGIFAGIFAVIMMITILVSWPFAQTPKDKIGLSYGGGIVEGPHFQGIHQPGESTFFNGFADKLYTYPVTQRNYIVSLNRDEGDRKGEDSIQAVTSDNVRVYYETFTGFVLNTDLIQKFHETLGLKFKAWTGGGWNKLLDQTLRQVQENALQRVTRGYTAKDLRSKAGTLEEVQKQVSHDLNERIIGVLGGNYFCNTDWQPGENCGDMQYLIKKVSVPDNIADSYEQNAKSLIDVQTKANEVAQRRQEALAIKELNQALETAGENYVLLKAVESGKINFWVLPSNSNLTLPTP